MALIVSGHFYTTLKMKLVVVSKRVAGARRKQRTANTGSRTRRSNLLERPIVVVCNSLDQVHLGTRDTADRSVPVVSDPHVQVPRVKVLKVLIERNEILQRESIGIKRKKRAEFF